MRVLNEGNAAVVTFTEFAKFEYKGTPNSDTTLWSTFLTKAGRKSPLATKNLLEDTDGLRCPPSKGGDVIHQCPLDAVAVCFC